MLSSTNQLYLNWLHSLVESARPGKTFLLLFKELHRTTFRADPKVPLDENRIVDALAIKKQFLVDVLMNPEEDDDINRVSVLEILILLAHNMGEITSNESNIPQYFFDLIGNLGIEIPDEDYYPYDDVNHKVYTVVMRFIKRRYNYNGLLFPLKNPHKDQRTVELWFQMNAYLIEQEDSWTS